MCKETPEEIFARAAAEMKRHMDAVNNKKTKDFDKWWHGKIWGWFEAAEGNLPRTRKILGLAPCECPNSATN